MHAFTEYGYTEADINYFFEFPEGDVSIVKIPCVEDVDGTLYEYKYEELLMPISLKANTKLKEMATRLSKLEEIVGKGEKNKEEKPVRDRLTSLEDILTNLVQAKPKQPPPGQHQ
jgi:hypothetical protein